jgi:hypothetical protein
MNISRNQTPEQVDQSVRPSSFMSHTLTHRPRVAILLVSMGRRIPAR